MSFVFAGHEIDLRRQELRRADEVVHIEPQVFDLLLHLVRNRDRVVSKDELLETIWNGRIVSEAALSSRISAARRAIGDDGDRQDLIRTIHKRGFRFVGEVQAATRQDGPATLASPGMPEPGMAAGQRPSVAVLPFDNTGSDAGTEYFAHGLTEDIIRLLARNRWLTVLGRAFTFPFRGKDIDPRAIGASLGVRYLVQGSVRRRGTRVRITTDLVGTATGRHLWSESQEFDLAAIFEVQDAMAQRLAAVIEPELAKLEIDAAARKPPERLDAWECYQRGLWHLWGFTEPGMDEAEAMFRRAVALDPGFARAHAALSYMHLQAAFIRSPAERPALLGVAMAEARTAVALDEGDCMCFCALGRVHGVLRNHEEALAALEQAIILNPSFAPSYYGLGFTLLWQGRGHEALAMVGKATELSPRDPHLSIFHQLRALAHFSLGELELAEGFARRAVRLPNASHWSQAIMVATLGAQGRIKEAQPMLEALLRRRPGYTQATARTDFFFCADEDLVERFVAGLRRAGVPGPMRNGTPAMLPSGRPKDSVAVRLAS
jgi:TolB-like protein